ncbi:hypothetical protein ACW5W4_06200 [Aeromonas crassostreae]
MVREALTADIPALVRLRMALFCELGGLWLHASTQGRALYEQFGFAGNPACLECSPAP